MKNNSDVVMASPITTVESLPPTVVKEDGFGCDTDAVVITELTFDNKEKDTT